MKKTILPLCLAFYSAFASSATINVVSYNQENFFDTFHDEGKDDWAYLPKSTPGKEEHCKETQTVPQYLEECLKTNWNERHFKMKLKNMASVIESMDSRPDLFGLVEIENENVVKALANHLGYEKYLVTNSPDERGIDVALIYKESDNLKFVSSTEHVLKAAELTKPTRNILEANFTVKEGDKSFPLLVMVNHWPSQSNPHLTRVRAAELVMNIIAKKVEENPNTHVLIMGDFNVTDKDNPHAFTTTLFKGPNALWDTHGLFMKSKDIAKEAKNQLPPGSYFYPTNMSWDLLDHFFISKNMTDGSGLEVKLNSYSIYRPKFIVKDYKFSDPAYWNYGTVIANVPNRFDPGAMFRPGMGFSDHFPITVQLELK